MHLRQGVYQTSYMCYLYVPIEPTSTSPHNHTPLSNPLPPYPSHSTNLTQTWGVSTAESNWCRVWPAPFSLTLLTEPRFSFDGSCRWLFVPLISRTFFFSDDEVTALKKQVHTKSLPTLHFKRLPFQGTQPVPEETRGTQGNRDRHPTPPCPVS